MICTYNDGSSFERDGQYVKATYFGWTLTGVVKFSRVTYGSGIKHYVVADIELTINGEVRPAGTLFAIHEDEIISAEQPVCM